MNESKKHNPRSWEKWRASGAVGTHPEIEARREEEAKAWVEAYFLDAVKSLPAGILNSVIRQERADHENRKRAQLARNGDAEPWLYETIKAHPFLTALEYNDPKSYERYGDTNNFSCMFQISPAELSEKIRRNPGYFNKYDNVIPWTAQGTLFRAIEKVGWGKMRQFIEAFKENPNLHGRTIERLSQTDPKSLVESKLHHENTLRALFLALYEEGITVSAMVG